ncbi:MAG TPA: protein-methionine-sulfoxide reductase catalytic subunit MsrP [Vicinamibacterales bacterium]|nr:protein-methionine-sulfoxide reductase catalytic subunit MsrP [Vicinamibacterales bacterium]
MLIKKASDIRSSEITPQGVYLRRREFIQASAATLIAAGLGCSLSDDVAAQGGGLAKLPNVKKSPLSTTETPSLYEYTTSYNNFYEFETGAGDGPKRNSKNFKARPWKIAVEGAVAKPGSYDIDEFIKPYALEERIYRMRCVEAWSFVIPWVGIPMADVIKRVEPTSKAKFVEFITLVDTGRFPMQRTDALDWPYIEGLRLDEAQHPLTLLAVGMYGEVLPAQNGAPIRLVVPWKYGFKGAKSLVKIRFVENQPINTWQRMARNEYGFYANVNPMVDHPRWSQARERRLPSFVANHRTEMFNGYADQVQGLYAGMDLRKNF